MLVEQRLHSLQLDPQWPSIQPASLELKHKGAGSYNTSRLEATVGAEGVRMVSSSIVSEGVQARSSSQNASRIEATAVQAGKWAAAIRATEVVQAHREKYQPADKRVQSVRMLVY